MEDLKSDIAEVARLEQLCTRPKISDHLSILKRKLETELLFLQEKTKPVTETSETVTNGDQQHRRVYTVPIVTYAFDQSEKFYKLYLTEDLKDIQSLPLEQFSSEFTPRSVKLTIREFKGKNRELFIKNLYEEIVPGESLFKVKKDMVLIMLRKKTSHNWPYVTLQEKIQQEKESSKSLPKLEKDADPNESLMNLMKTMYESGDDEMKRTIAKAWTESRQKIPGSEEF